METTVTYTFTSGTKARSAQINQNFTDLKTGINTLEAVGQYKTWVGNAGGVTSALNTSLLGKVTATYLSVAITVTIAAPNVVTHTSHGLATGDSLYLTTTGALPTGLAINTTYYIFKVDANSYNLCTTRQNAYDGVKITTTGSQSGTHTAYTGGLHLPITAANVNKSLVRYSTAAGQSIASAGATEIVDFGTKIFDTKAEVTTGASWKFTAKDAGYYRIHSLTSLTTAAWAASKYYLVELRKNGSVVSNMELYPGAQTLEASANFHDVISLAAGDYIDIRIDHNQGGAISLISLATYNYITIEQVG